MERHEATSRRLQQLLAEIDPPDSAYGEESTTDEQQSGRTADAVRRLQEELKDRYSKLSDAEGKLSEVLLNAKATTVDGQQKLNEIQAKIVEAINNPALSLDTPAGEQAFLKFLRSQVAAIGDVLQSGTLTAEDQSKAIAVIAVGFSNPAGAVVGVKEVDVDAAGGARSGLNATHLTEVARRSPTRGAPADPLGHPECSRPALVTTMPSCCGLLRIGGPRGWARRTDASSSR